MRKNIWSIRAFPSRAATTASTMQFNMLIALLIVSCLSVSLAQVAYEDCCFKYVTEMKHKTQKHAVDYRLQVLDGGCNIEAVIFIMRRGRVLCANPKESWVKKLQEKIDGRKDTIRKPRKNQRRPLRG